MWISGTEIRVRHEQLPRCVHAAHIIHAMVCAVLLQNVQSWLRSSFGICFSQLVSYFTSVVPTMPRASRGRQGSHSGQQVASSASASTDGQFSDEQRSELQRMIANAVSAGLAASSSPVAGSATGASPATSGIVTTAAANPAPPASSGTASTSTVQPVELATASNVGKPAAAFSHLSSTVIDKIRRGDFIDLVTLLPAFGSSVIEPAAKRVRLSDDGESLVVSQSTASKRKIDSMLAWTEAWSVYCAVILSQQSERAFDLVCYQLLICQAARKYKLSAVLEYDARFRQSAAIDRTMVWSSVNPDLYTQCMTGQALALCTSCKRPGHIAANCNFRARGQASSGSPELCRRYNSGICTLKKCRYTHSCSSCGGGHPASSCPKE